ncbi:hypothetical protein [Plantactinospora sp. CA-290183]|uniref:hypothetical protein n=1 Tax=Plantactinospora sp. CA-290183 TaxID=3240006 RepID=UPI003D917FB7
MCAEPGCATVRRGGAATHTGQHGASKIDHIFFDSEHFSRQAASASIRTVGMCDGRLCSDHHLLFGWLTLLARQAGPTLCRNTAEAPGHVSVRFTVSGSVTRERAGRIVTNYYLGVEDSAEVGTPPVDGWRQIVDGWSCRTTWRWRTDPDALQGTCTAGTDRVVISRD